MSLNGQVGCKYEFGLFGYFHLRRLSPLSHTSIQKYFSVPVRRLFVWHCRNFLFAFVSCLLVTCESLWGASGWVFLLPVLQPLPARGLLAQAGGEQSRSDPRRVNLLQDCLHDWLHWRGFKAGGREREKERLAHKHKKRESSWERAVSDCCW